MTEENKKVSKAKRKRPVKKEPDSKEPVKKVHTRKRPKKKETIDEGVNRVRGKERKVANIDVKPFDVPSIIFKRIVELSKDINKDVMLKFDREGVYASNIDIMNTSAMWMDAVSEMYSYEGNDEVNVCIEVSRLEKSIRGSDKDDISKVTISKGEVFIETDGIVVRSPIFVDCQEVSEVVYHIADKLPNRMTISLKPILKFIDKAKGEEGHLAIRLKDSNISIVKLNYDSDSEDVRLNIKKHNLKDATIHEDCESLYSKELLFPVFTALSKISKNVKIYIGRNHPMFINVDIPEYTVNYIVAPRIGADD